MFLDLLLVLLLLILLMFKINRTKCFKFLGNYCLCFCFDRKNDCKICKTGAKFAYGWCLVSVCSFTSEVWYYLCIQVIPRVSTQSGMSEVSGIDRKLEKWSHMSGKSGRNS